MYYGATLDDKYHTWHDWGLKMLSFYIPMPEPKEDKVDIPGGDGVLDFTEANGRPFYSERTDVELTFDISDIDMYEWFKLYSKIAMAIHGRKVKMIMDEEPEFYYLVRFKLEGKMEYYKTGEFTLKGTAEPFKMDLVASNEDWLWDSFNFETGVIQELMDLSITKESNTVTIFGGGIDTAPIFHVEESADLAFVYEGRMYNLSVGRNRFLGVRVGTEDVTLVFSGTGKLSIEYRGRYL